MASIRSHSVMILLKHFNMKCTSLLLLPPLCYLFVVPVCEAIGDFDYYPVAPLSNYMKPFGKNGAFAPKFTYRSKAETIPEPNNYNVAFLVPQGLLRESYPKGGYRRMREPLVSPVMKPHSSFPPKEIEAQLIEIEAPSLPLVLSFQTRSSKIVTLQNHIPQEVEDVKETESVEKPHKLVNVVIHPVIQEIKEIITPYRKITQEIMPVQEEVLTIISTPQKPKPLTASGFLGSVGNTPAYRPPSYAKKYIRRRE